MRNLKVLALISGISAAAGLGCGSSGKSTSDGGGAGSGGHAGGQQAGSGGRATGTGGSGGAGSGTAGSGGTASGVAGSGGSGGKAGGAGGSTGGVGGKAGAGGTGSGGKAGGAGGKAGGAGGKAGAGAGGSGGAPTIGTDGGTCVVPAAAEAADVSNPTTVVGTGTAASCTAAKVATAVAGGGVVTFNCGSAPLTIVVPEIEIFNDGGVTKDGSVTIDGGGKITLSGGGQNRILRQNTCDANLHYTSTRCDIQTTPHLVVQNIGFTGGIGLAEQVDSNGVYGGGALYVQGGTFKAVNITVTNSQQTNASGQNVQDLGGGAIYATEISGPAYVVNSTFQGNSGINGGALASINVSWTVLNSVFQNNSAIGHGENPAAAGTEGGGLGGVIYNDGNAYTLTVCGSRLLDNQANELGTGAIFEVVDALNGYLVIDQSTFTGNSDNGDVQQGAHHPGIYVEALDKLNGTSGVTITNTTFN